MRMRRKKNREARFENCIEFVVQNPETVKGEWCTKLFKRKAPLHVEIGCGKGGFITKLAALHPEINYVAMEKCVDALILALEKAKAMEIKNVLFISGDAENLTEIFAPGEADRIYLNFSDPWKKSKQAKRRLTHRRFLEKYKTVLNPDGELHFKTDNRPLFDFSLEEFEAMNMHLSELTNELHNSEYDKDNIRTEYEETFSAKGFPINRCVCRF